MSRSFSSTSDNLSRSTLTIPQSAGTVGLWCKPTWASTDNSSHWFLDIRNAGATSIFQLLKFSDNNLYAGWKTSGTAYWVQVNSGSYTLTQNAWNHLLLIWNSSGSTLYLNGSSIGTAGAPTTWDTGGNSFYLGNGGGGGTTGDCRGLLSSVMIWGVVLSVSEITQLANGSDPRRCRLTGQLQYWPLYGVGSPEPDMSGNGFSMTVNGTAAGNNPPVQPFLPQVQPFWFQVA